VTALDPTGLKPSLAQRLLRSTGVRKWTVPATKFDHWAAHPRPAYSGRPPKWVMRRILVERADLGGRPVYEVRPRGIHRDALAGDILYLHGGGYVLDLIPLFHWPAIAKLANTLRRNVTVPIYPIAPEHTYREVFPFLLGVYRRMLQTRDPKSITFMGDSAGGGMSFALCHAVRDAGLPQPSDAVLLSPWMHVGLPDPGVPAVAKIDPVLDLDNLRAAGTRYSGGDPLDTPLISPSVGPLTGLPRLTVFTGTHDVLNPDTRAFYERATTEGVDIGWYERPGGIHGWMFLPNRHGREAMTQIRQLLGD
jgi:acetyl esterase/lipase